jgi:hypothetical protein
MGEVGRNYITLDDQTVLEAAQSDPAGFIRGLDRAIIDEVQRAPDLLLAIKKTVDEDYRPGRFLLTGSANVLTLPRIADSLAGRMETLQILAFVGDTREQPRRSRDPVARFTTSGCGLWVAATRKKQSDFHRRSPIARPGDRGLLSSLPTS